MNLDGFLDNFTIFSTILNDPVAINCAMLLFFWKNVAPTRESANTKSKLDYYVANTIKSWNNYVKLSSSYVVTLTEQTLENSSNTSVKFSKMGFFLKLQQCQNFL